uniref:Molybdate transport system substrate-binding protein n=1 Tax=Candidatus Kentrum eta TaxID=2126337 RepID=A0A450UHW7_9GAMM|nr:MAG: molybdate transport system substrate-binding protein [Candidatus Kentron sp. H]VFJ92126.1 MAG: molybdate transport system substrate-binding protein [Candidatus Kentron sp. H]VFJ98712.1 MAG: molybdate transport system substrate-binding protein [Candidatus Kentron sp. H]
MRFAYDSAYKVMAPILIALAMSTGALAGEVSVAAAANFRATMKALAEDFEDETGHKASLSFGSTGKLYAQILHGAPFEVFLAADQRRPRLLREKRLVKDRHTYAIGKLVLWRGDGERKVDRNTLAEGAYHRVALANPRNAPYGAAALTVLERLGVADKVPVAKRVRGDNVAQAYQFVATGNADIGFVALSQVMGKDGGSVWRIPEALYEPIRQDAVLLARGEDNPAARALFDYLKRDAAQGVIRRYGYGIQ